MIRKLMVADRGSLPLAMLVVMVASGLVALMVPMLTVQTKSTTFNQSRTHELAAAHAGLNVGMGEIRAAGDLATLPCTATTPLAGSVGGDGSPEYRVTVDYFLTNPAGKDAPALAASVMSCGDAHTSPPQYAMVTSTGADGRASRTLQSVYAFITGGAIYLWSTDETKYCLTAPDDFVAGGTIVAQECRMNGAMPDPLPGQVWVYTAAGQFKLAASDVTGALCMTNGATIALSPCDAAAAAQQWKATGDIGRIQLSGGRCLQSPAAGGTLTLATCTASSLTADRTQRWVLSPYTGAGTAAAARDTGYRQFVNFQTGRCIDAGESADGMYPAARMCLTVPDGAYSASRQGIGLNGATAQLALGTGSCLVPGDTVDGLVTLTVAACGPSPVWTFDDATHTINTGGGCLAVATTTRVYAKDGFPRLTLEACSPGSPLQQWVPRSDRSGLFGLREIVAPGS